MYPGIYFSGVTGLIILIGERKISYESLVRDFMSDEASYLRDLSLIIKVIKKKFDEAPNIFSEQVSFIFLFSTIPINNQNLSLLGC